MGRPPLPVGTFGNIGFLLLPSGEVQARARFRDFDGYTRLCPRPVPPAPRPSGRALKTETAQAPAATPPCKPPTGDPDALDPGRTQPVGISWSTHMMLPSLSLNQAARPSPSSSAISPLQRTPGMS